jgi:hypothetical protein
MKRAQKTFEIGYSTLSDKEKKQFQKSPVSVYYIKLADWPFNFLEAHGHVVNEASLLLKKHHYHFEYYYL